MSEWTYDDKGAWGGEHRLGDDRQFVSVHPGATAFDTPDVWDIHLHVSGSSTLQSIRGLDKAKRIAEFLYVELLPEELAARERSEARYAESERRRAVQAEQERPAREKAAREREARLAEAPVEEAGKCPECGHVAELDEFDERGYECGQDGSTGRGEEGRRCDQCQKFRARVSDRSCPSCEAPLDEVETVSVKRDGGELVETEAGFE